MNKKRKINIITIAITIAISMFNVVYAHPGRTDSSGGHKDKNNVSGLGSYHYHCEGYDAHLHEGGVCPYSAPSVSTTTTPSQPVQQETVVGSEPATPVVTETPVTVPAVQEKVEPVQQEVQALVEEKVETVEEVIETEDNTEISEEVIKEEAAEEVVNEVEEEEKKVEVVAEQKESSNIAENVVTDETTEDDTLAGIVGLGAIGGGVYWFKKRK